jgi:adenylosuccinate lyase
LLLVLAEWIEKTAEQPVMAFTHIQPAEPTTLGYRLAVYAQDLLEDQAGLKTLRAMIRGKGFKGAVGTGAAYMDLIGAENFAAFEEQLSKKLELEFYAISTQTCPRKQDYEVVCGLAGLGASLSKQAFDLRLLQTPPIGELSEPFGDRQVGSSAMPFKRNPINSEKINSLARLLTALQQTAWQNAANSLLERTLDDSANRRIMLPQAFLICDELLHTMLKIMQGLNSHDEAIQRNLETYAPFAATERVMMAAARKGADRQEMHERLRGHALAAWEAVQAGKANPLAGMLKADAEIKQYLDADELDALMDISSYTGIASDRARQMAASIRTALVNG